MEHMPNSKVEILRISRRLTPDNRTKLLSWVRLAYFAEKSAGKGIDAVIDGVSISKLREYSCGNLAQRSKK
jgi:PP-loop superfamily ATP-utilizing enzyme